MQTKSISRTAKEMGLSQPAASHALNRLRIDLKDPLLVRSARAMVPTPYALGLASSVDKILSDLENLLTPSHFNPQTAKATIRIKSTDYFEQLVLSKLLKKLEQQASQIKVIFMSTDGRLPKQDLEEGACDLAIAGFFGDLPDQFFQQKLFQDELVCMRKRVKSEKSSSLNMERYLAMKHVYISPEGKLDGGSIDEFLRTKGQSRKIDASVAGFMTPAWICTDTSYACTLPKKLATLFKKYLPISLHDLPFKTPPIQVVQVWHQRTHADSLHKYMRSLIQQTCGEL